MPGPNRSNKPLADRKAEMTQSARYFLMDPKCAEFNGKEVTDEMRDKGVTLTAAEAMHFVAGGAITADKGVAQTAWEAVKARDDAKAKAAEAANSDAADREAAEANSAETNTPGAQSPAAGTWAEGQKSAG